MKSTTTCQWPKRAFKWNDIGCGFIWEKGGFVRYTYLRHFMHEWLSTQTCGRNWSCAHLRSDLTTSLCHGADDADDDDWTQLWSIMKLRRKCVIMWSVFMEIHRKRIRIATSEFKSQSFMDWLFSQQHWLQNYV